MSGQPAQFNATKTSPLKRKRAPVWPFATRAALDEALAVLIERGTISERSPKDEWSIHPSTEARGSAFQWEKWVWGSDDLGQWKEVKLRQHAQDPTRTAGRTGVEGGYVSNLNADLVQLLRSNVRGRRGESGKQSTSRNDGGAKGSAAKEDMVSAVRGDRHSPGPMEKFDQLGSGEASGGGPSTHQCAGDDHEGPATSADRNEEEAAAWEGTNPVEVMRPVSSPPRDQLDSWSNYLERPIIWINPGPSPRPLPSAAVQWFSFTVQRRPASSSPSPDRVPEHGRDPSGSSVEGPSHISNSVETDIYDSPPSVPSTVPAIDPDSPRPPSPSSAESGRASRWEREDGSRDNVWRFPDGSRHPRNIYNDLDTSDDSRSQ